MAADSPSIRLNVDRGKAPFLRRQSKLLTAAWDDLLCHVKLLAPYKGRIRFTSAEDLADDMLWPADEAWAVGKLVELAMQGDDPALAIEDGYLVVVKWRRYQSADAERVRRKRELKNVTDKSDLLRTKANCNGQSVTVTDSSNMSEHSLSPLDGPPSPQHSPSPPIIPPHEDSPPFVPPADLEVVEGDLVEDVDEASVPLFPVSPDDPWWDGEDVDSLVREAVESYLQVPRFAKTPPHRARFEKMIADQRARAPNDDAIRYEFEGFVAHYLNSKKYTDGVATMRNWFGIRHERWAGMRRKTTGLRNAANEMRRAMDGIG